MKCIKADAADEYALVWGFVQHYCLRKLLSMSIDSGRADWGALA